MHAASGGVRRYSGFCPCSELILAALCRGGALNVPALVAMVDDRSNGLCLVKSFAMLMDHDFHEGRSAFRTLWLFAKFEARLQISIDPDDLRGAA